MPDSPILQTVDQQRRQIEAVDAQTLERVARAYAVIAKRLERELEALVLQLEKEGQLSKRELLASSRYRILMEQTQQELQKYTGYLTVELNTAVGAGIDVGSQHAGQLLSTIIAGNGSIAARFAYLPREAIETLLAFLSPNSPLYKRIQEIAPFTAEQVSQTIIEGVGIGKNPREIARQVTNAYGMGLTNAMRLVRTAQLWAYREANRAQFAANSDIVTGWYWHAKLDSGTCLSCIYQHGKFYPLTETLNDHHNGRCAMVPGVKGFPPPFAQDAGEQWFNSQPESVQRSMMGKGRYEAWAAGKFDLSKITNIYEDDIYGRMRRESTLKELLANE